MFLYICKTSTDYFLKSIKKALLSNRKLKCPISFLESVRYLVCVKISHTLCESALFLFVPLIYQQQYAHNLIKDHFYLFHNDTNIFIYQERNQELFRAGKLSSN